MKKKISKSARSSFINYGIVILFFVVIEVMKGTGNLSNALSGQLVPICAYIIMAVSLTLVVGISGELSLGHAGFMSVGAFTGVTVVALLQQSVESKPLCFLAAVIVGALMAALAGLIVGIPVLRLRGDYLAIVTLAFGEIIKNVIGCLYVGVDAQGLHFSLKSEAALGLVNGRTVINGPMGAKVAAPISSFLFGCVLILITLFIIQNLIHSRSGRAIMAIRDNRIAAEASGLNITKYKLMAFVTSAAFAGVAGVLYGLNFATIAAKKFDFNTSIIILVFVVLGGMSSIRGSMIAAALLTVLPEMLRQFNEWRMLIYAIVLIVVMILTNNERAKSIWRRLVERITGRNKSRGGALNE